MPVHIFRKNLDTKALYNNNLSIFYAVFLRAVAQAISASVLEDTFLCTGRCQDLSILHVFALFIGILRLLTFDR